VSCCKGVKNFLKISIFVFNPQHFWLIFRGILAYFDVDFFLENPAGMV